MLKRSFILSTISVRAMDTNEPEPTLLTAMHQCGYCGHLCSREEIPELGHISGVIECPKCGEAGALNVVVQTKASAEFRQTSP